MEDISPLFNDLLSLMITQGLNPSWIREGILAEDRNALLAENGLTLPEDIIQIVTAHDGMTNEAFYNAPFFERYHLYNLKTTIKLYRYDICERDFIINYDGEDVEPTEFFPLLVEDSHHYCVKIAGSDIGGVYHLDDINMISKAYDSLAHFFRVMLKARREGVLIFEYPYITNEQRFSEIESEEA